jgi:hypothetical protein
MLTAAVCFQHHLAALVHQEMGNIFHGLARRRARLEAMVWYLPISATWRNLEFIANYITKMKSCSMIVPSC